MTGARQAVQAIARRGTVFIRIAIALTIAGAVGFHAANQATSSVLPADLLHAIEAFDRAQMNADTATLSGLVTDDYVLVNSDASVDRKAKYLADFLLPGLALEPYVVEQRIEKTWDGTAVVFGLQRLTWTQSGVRHHRVLRLVHVWTRRSGRWQATHTQLTRVPS
ncbi:MAG: nuclear transport factor 2 family protein [Vicinamibacterales bacterium]